MTDKTYRKTTFAGLDSHYNTARVPRWYRSMTGTRDPALNFRDALAGLETATKVPLAYLDTEDLPATAEQLRSAVIKASQSTNDPLAVLEEIGVVQSGKYRALVNPAWLGKANRDASDAGDAMWQPPTDQYVPVNPMDAYGPLIGVTRQKLAEERPEVFGQIREYAVGGEVHMDIFFGDIRTQIPNGPEFIWGVTTGYDFRGYHSHYAHLIAVDPDTKTVYRRLHPNAGKRRHVGPRSGKETATEEVAAWWVDILDQLEAATDALLSTVADAMDHEFDAAGLLDDPRVALEANGLGPYADPAAKLLPSKPTLSAYDYFVAAAKALDQEFDGKDDGAAAKDYTNAANRFLFRPATAEKRALRRQAELLDDMNNLTTADQVRRKDIRDAEGTLSDATDEARSFRKRLREILDAAQEQADEEDEADEADAETAAP